MPTFIHRENIKLLEALLGEDTVDPARRQQLIRLLLEEMASLRAEEAKADAGVAEAE